MNKKKNSEKSKIISFVDSGEYAKAKCLSEKFCAKNKGDIDARMLLTAICGKVRDFEGMEHHSRILINQQPNMVSAYHNLGIALASQGRFPDAVNVFGKALSLRPEYIESRLSLAEVYTRLSQFNEAIKQFDCALTIDSARADIYYRLGVVLHQQGEKERSIRALENACHIDGNFIAAYKMLHSIYYDDGYFEKAKAYCRNVLDVLQDDGVEIREATMVPVIMESRDEIATFRKNLFSNINNLLQKKLTVQDPVREIGYTNFQLVYHAQNDREIQEKLAQLYLHACPDLAYVANVIYSEKDNTDYQKIKLGIISKHLKDHSIGKAAMGLLEHLSRKLFHITAFFLEQPVDDMGKYLWGQADKAVVTGYDLPAARSRIERESVDILFYQDIGMEPFTYFLAFSRLAPVQCTYFGHPVTTGIPAMDYFISTNYHEGSDYKEHYSEQVILLNDVAAPSYCYKRESTTKYKPRSYFGFDDEEHIYFCPQTLFKFHPDMDLVFAKILRSDSKGRIILKEGFRPTLVDMLKNRFSKSIPDVMSRITFLPQQSNEDYFSLFAAADVVLDTVHFGGFTTTLDAFSVASPVVTWPTELMCSRHTTSLYNKMGVDACIAGSLDDYVTRAIRIATDKDYHDQLALRIADTCETIWEEGKLIREFERIFQLMVKNNRRH